MRSWLGFEGRVAGVTIFKWVTGGHVDFHASQLMISSSHVIFVTGESIATAQLSEIGHVGVVKLRNPVKS